MNSTAARLVAVLFRKETWAGLEDGSITVAFRWWKRPTVAPGGTLQSPGGLLAIETVDVIGPSTVTLAEATAAGFPSLAALRRDLDATRRDGAHLHRIGFRRLGDDPRVSLRADAELDDDTVADLRTRLDRMDARAENPWTRAVLDVIADHPGVVSRELAPDLGLDRDTFKIRVRRLKALGLTESLDVGYRLSPRGEALRARLDERT